MAKHTAFFSFEEFVKCSNIILTSVLVLLLTTETFSQTKHLLNLCLKGKFAANTNVWKIDNPELIVGFEKRARSMLTLSAFVDSSSLDARNSRSRQARARAREVVRVVRVV